MSMAMLNNVQFTMTQLMPKVISLGGESLVSLNRIADFLLSKELQPSNKLWLKPIRPENLSQLSITAELKPDRTRDHKPLWDMFDQNKLVLQIPSFQSEADKKKDIFVSCQSIGASWPRATIKTLESITFDCKKDDFIMICGEVASGKTSLFLSLLNELPISEGSARVSGTISYCSQNAWIFMGTVMENIVFGNNFDESRYRRVIEVCALGRDLDLLENGDLTYIGEDSLSGGQKARVNLARCLYHDCDIYLLDDPLSALDSQVATHVFDKAIRGFLSDKLVIMASHQIRFLKHCDRVLLLDEGKQLLFSTYEELASKLLAPAGEYFTQGQLDRLSHLCRSVKSFTNVSANKEAIDFGDNQQNETRTHLATTPSVEFNKYDAVKDNQKSESRNVAGKSSLANFAQEESSGHNNASVDLGETVNPVEEKHITNIHTTITSDKIDRCQADPTPNNHAQSRNDEEASPPLSTCLPPPTSGEESIIEMDAQQSLEPNSHGQHKVVVNLQEQSNPSWNDVPYGPRYCTVGEEMKASANKAPHGGSDKASLITHSNVVPARLRETDEANFSTSTSGRPVDNLSACNLTTSVPNGRVDPLNIYLKSSIDENRHTCTPASGIDVSCLAPSDREEEAKVRQVPTNDLSQVSARKESKHHCDRSPKVDFQERKATYRPTCDNRLVEEFPMSSAPIKSDRLINVRPAQGLIDEELTSSDHKLAGIDVWFKYYTQGSKLRLILLILTFLVTQAVFSTIDVYLTVWSMIEQNKALLIEIKTTNEQILVNSKHEIFMDFADKSGTPSGSNEISLVPVSNCTELNISDSSEIGLNSASRSYLNKFQYDCAPTLRGRNSPTTQTRATQKSIGQSSARIADTTMYSIAEDVSSNRRIEDGPQGGGKISSSISHGEDQDGALVSMKIISTAQTQSELIDSHQEPTDLTNEAAHLFQTFNITNSSLIFDEEIFKESESAQNVGGFYRPLYILVGKLPTRDQAMIYAVLLLTLFVTSSITNALSYSTSYNSSKKLYEKLTDSALFAKLAFFDSNPIGRLINRATRDIGIIDEAIPYNANQSYDALLQTAATFMIVSAVNLKLAPLSLTILFIFLIYHSIHVKPTKDIQRIEGLARSPIISHISTTLNGLQTIRVTKSQSRFVRTFTTHQDAHTSVFVLKLGCNRSMAVILDLLNASYIGLIAITAVASSMSGPSAGLVITSAMLLSGLTQHGVMKLTETESLMTSVERVIEYCNLPQEEPTSKRGLRRPYNALTKGLGSFWPTRGCLEFRNVDLYYSRDSGKPVLRNISFKVQPGEKIGIIGRTGAGKSSIITTLLRLYEYDGAILLDGVDIKTLNLIELRSSIGIIPQSPVLFSDSIRENLDPMKAYDDVQLWSALDKANLRETIINLPGQLSYDIGRGGLSTGQKQLICLARVLLRRNRLIVMDEATANVDPSTDALIQATIRREFKCCTVITIAHRMGTILDCDRVMVLDAGRMVDFDTPQCLAAKRNGSFCDLLSKSSTN